MRAGDWWFIGVVISCGGLIVGSIGYSAVNVWTESRCLAAGYTASRVALTGVFCVSRQDQSDRVVPYDEALTTKRLVE